MRQKIIGDCFSFFKGSFEWATQNPEKPQKR